MVSLKDIIHSMSLKEQSSFRVYLTLKNKRHDTRNISLFDAFLKEEEEVIFKEIGANAYNALKKRVKDRLIEFLASSSLLNEYSSESSIIQLILVSRRLFTHHLYDAGFKLLYKAEKKGIELLHYSLLNEVYHTMIEFSYHNSKLNQDELFKKLISNNHNFLVQEKLNMMYANIQKEYKSKDFESSKLKFDEIYSQAYQRFNIKEDWVSNFKNIYQLAVIFDLHAAEYRNYDDLEVFFENAIKSLQGGERDVEKMLYYHINVLYIMSNIYFRKKRFEKSIYYLNDMYQQMKRYDGKYYAQWKFRHQNLLLLNLNFSGKYNEALSKLNLIFNDTSISDQDHALLTLTKILLSFEISNVEEVKKIFKKLNKSDQWYITNVGKEWLFHIKAMEILLHFDLGNDNLVDSKINSFYRKFSYEFKNDKTNDIWKFLKVLKMLLDNRQSLKTIEFKKMVKNYFPSNPTKENDLFFICYYAWLKSKLNKQSIYSIILQEFN